MSRSHITNGIMAIDVDPAGAVAFVSLLRWKATLLPPRSTLSSLEGSSHPELTFKKSVPCLIYSGVSTEFMLNSSALELFLTPIC